MVAVFTATVTSFFSYIIFNSLAFIVVCNCSFYSFFCKNRTMNFCRRKPAKLVNNLLVSYL